MDYFKLIPIDLINAGFSGALLLLSTIIIRLRWLRPKLQVSFNAASIDLGRFIPLRDNTNNIIALESWVRLRIENRGILKLTNPKVSCVEIFSRPGDTRISEPITPFELAWSEAFKDGELSVLFPGKFHYRFDLVRLPWGKPGKQNSPPQLNSLTDFFFARKDRSLGKEFPVGVRYEALILIANDNFLVPSHFVRLLIKIVVLDRTQVPTESGLAFEIEILGQGDWWNRESQCDQVPCCGQS